MKIISAGWGDPPKDLNYDRAVNTSRILARTKCGEFDGYVYTDGRVPDRPDQPALFLGSEWHKALERLSYGDSAHMIAEEYELADWADETSFPWFKAALTAYEDHYGSQYPGGTILATEVPFYLLVEMEPIGVIGEEEYLSWRVLIRGRLDRVTEWHGQACNGEIKTTAAGKLDQFWKSRQHHPQDAFYYLALCCAGKKLPNGAELPPSVYGTRYDITSKYTLPKGRKKDRSDLPGLLETWRSKLFYEDGVAWNVDRAKEVASKALCDYIGLAGIRHRNYAACLTYGQCPYYEVCHEGLSLDSAHFKDREPDYVG